MVNSRETRLSWHKNFSHVWQSKGGKTKKANLGA